MRPGPKHGRVLNAERIQARLRELNATRAQLAGALGVSPQTVSVALSRGRRVSLATAVSYAYALELPLETVADMQRGGANRCAI